MRERGREKWLDEGGNSEWERYGGKEWREKWRITRLRKGMRYASDMGVRNGSRKQERVT